MLDSVLLRTGCQRVPLTKRLHLTNVCNRRKPSHSAVCQAQRDTNRVQELQNKARLLKQQLQELSQEAEQLDEDERQQVQDELKTNAHNEASYPDIPDPVKRFLAEAGVLDAMPWHGPPADTDPSLVPYCQPPAPNSYDWDYSSDTLDDAISGLATAQGQEATGQAGSPQGTDAFQEAEDSDDEAGFPEDDQTPFEAGAGVEAIMRMLEEGGTLPDIEGLAAAEDPQEFQLRVQKLVDRYEAQFLKKKDRKISTEEIREMEKEEAWKPTTRIPVVDEDILEVRPAPAVPDPIQLQYEALQQGMLLLRRAHLTGRVDAPVKALASAGLVDMEKVTYRDVLADLTGIGPWLHYMEALQQAGGWTQVEHVWADVSHHRPNPVYRILVDQYVNVPLPDWYFHYLRDNAPLEHWTEEGQLDVPALGAVHHTAPEDPSVPLQRAQQAQEPRPTQPLRQPQANRSQPPFKQQSHRKADASKTMQQDNSSDRQPASEIDPMASRDAPGNSSADTQAASGLRANKPGHASRSKRQGAADLIADNTDSQEAADATAGSGNWGQSYASEASNEEGEQQEGLASCKAQARLLPYFRELQMHVRTDADVQASLRQDLPEGIEIPVDVQLLARVSYMDDGLANMVLPETQDIAPHYAGTAPRSENVADTGAVPNSDIVAMSEQRSAFLPSLDLLGQFGSSDSSRQTALTGLETEAPSGSEHACQAGVMQTQSKLGAKPASNQRNQCVQPPEGLDSSQQPTSNAAEVQLLQPLTDPDIKKTASSGAGAAASGTKAANLGADDADSYTVNDASVNLTGAQVLTPDGEWQPVTQKAQAGTAWTNGSCMTLGTTIEYEMCAVSRKIVNVTCGWATIDAYALTVQDMMDVYIKVVGLDDFAATAGIEF